MKKKVTKKAPVPQKPQAQQPSVSNQVDWKPQDRPNFRVSPATEQIKAVVKKVVLEQCRRGS